MNWKSMSCSKVWYGLNKIKRFSMFFNTLNPDSACVQNHQLVCSAVNQNKQKQHKPAENSAVCGHILDCSLITGMLTSACYIYLKRTLSLFYCCTLQCQCLYKYKSTYSDFSSPCQVLERDNRKKSSLVKVQLVQEHWDDLQKLLLCPGKEWCAKSLRSCALQARVGLAAMPLRRRAGDLQTIWESSRRILWKSMALICEAWDLKVHHNQKQKCTCHEHMHMNTPKTSKNYKIKHTLTWYVRAILNNRKRTV